MSGVAEALARLLVDPEARRRLSLQPQGLGAAYRLTDEELKAMVDLDPEALELAADTLRRKRLARLSAVYPWTLKALHLGSGGALGKFMAGHPPAAGGGPAAALEGERERFRRFVAGRSGPGADLAADLLRFEECKRRLAMAARPGVHGSGERVVLRCRWDVLSTGAALDLAPPRLEPSPGPVRLLMSLGGTPGAATVRIHRLVPRER